MDQNIDFFGDDQIQNPQYPDVQENPLTNDEFEAYTNANDANMNDLEFKLDNFQKNHQDFQEKFEQMQDDLLNQMRNFMQNLHDGPPDIEYVEALLPDPEIVSVEEENVVQQEEEEERLIYLVKNDTPNDSSNDPLLEEVDLFLFDYSIPPGIENIADDPEGDIRFLEELLIDDSILSHESFDSNFEENPSTPRPPPEPPDVETDAGE
nr:hypothetical protein [Tanacetum cinerariifolium]